MRTTGKRKETVENGGKKKEEKKGGKGKKEEKCIKNVVPSFNMTVLGLCL